MDICSSLGRTDGKWYLGGGERLLFAPPHPEYVDRLGFWDPVHYFDIPVPTPFTVSLLDDANQPVRLHRTNQHWQPDRLRQTFKTETSLQITERKALCPSDVLLSRLTLENTGDNPVSIRAVAWTRQPAGDGSVGIREIEPNGDQILYRQQLLKNGRPPHDVVGSLALRPKVSSSAVIPSESAPSAPRWIYTPFYETLDGSTIGPSPSGPEVPHSDGWYYFGLLTSVTVPPSKTRTITAALGLGPENAKVGDRVRTVLDDQSPLTRSSTKWESHFDRVPSLSCSDDYLETAYWYRWYGLHLLSRDEPVGNFSHPAVYEGPEYFRKHITFSAQCHMREMRWLPTPTYAQGSLLNFIDVQREDGGFHGHVFPQHIHEESFYHTNWGQTWDVHRIHPDRHFLKRAYAGLSDYVEYFDRERDPEDSSLYDIFNHYETGQEYMRRYTAVEPEADEVHWGRIFRLKGVDAAVQIYQTKQALAKMAETLDRPDQAHRWRNEAEQTAKAIRTKMWDPNDEMFYDVDPESGDRTGVKAAVCFYPYFTDLIEEKHVPGLKRHLFDPDAFWTPYPVPSTSRDDPSFSASPHWKGERKNCPWNGRVWPMTNSHIAEALGTTAIRFDDETLRERTATFITRFVRMLFFDGDPDRPNCFEHYNPLTGQACRYRGIDDYQHSWLVDLLIRYLAGIRPHDRSVVVDPFPFDVDQMTITDVPVRGHRLEVTRTAQEFDVTVDGEREASSVLGSRVQLQL